MYFAYQQSLQLMKPPDSGHLIVRLRLNQLLAV